MMRRSTVVLLTYAGIGGGIMALTAGALAQAAATPSQPAGSHDAVLALLGPGASGVIGALVVAVYNQVSTFIREFNLWKTKLEEEHKALKALIAGRPCMDPEPGTESDCPVPHRKRGRG